MTNHTFIDHPANLTHEQSSEGLWSIAFPEYGIIYLPSCVRTQEDSVWIGRELRKAYDAGSRALGGKIRGLLGVR